MKTTQRLIRPIGLVIADASTGLSRTLRIFTMLGALLPTGFLAAATINTQVTVTTANNSTTKMGGSVDVTTASGNLIISDPAINFAVAAGQTLNVTNSGKLNLSNGANITLGTTANTGLHINNATLNQNHLINTTAKYNAMMGTAALWNGISYTANTRGSLTGSTAVMNLTGRLENITLSQNATVRGNLVHLVGATTFTVSNGARINVDLSGNTIDNGGLSAATYALNGINVANSAATFTMDNSSLYSYVGVTNGNDGLGNLTLVGVTVAGTFNLLNNSLLDVWTRPGTPNSGQGFNLANLAKFNADHSTINSLVDNNMSAIRFRLGSTATISTSNLNLTTTGAMAAFTSEGVLNIDNSTLVLSRSTGNGTAFTVNSGDAIIKDSAITATSTGADGAGSSFRATGATANTLFTNTTFVGTNTSGAVGGSIITNDTGARITFNGSLSNLTLTNTPTATTANALYNNATFILTDSAQTHLIGAKGNGIYNAANGTLIVDNDAILNANSTAGNAIYNTANIAVANGGRINLTGNFVSTAGNINVDITSTGTIALRMEAGSKLSLTNTTFTNNVGVGYGITGSSGGTMVEILDGSTFTNNVVNNGRGISLSNGGSFLISNATLYNIGTVSSGSNNIRTTSIDVTFGEKARIVNDTVFTVLGTVNMSPGVPVDINLTGGNQIIAGNGIYIARLQGMTSTTRLSPGTGIYNADGTYVSQIGTMSVTTEGSGQNWDAFIYDWQLGNLAKTNGASHDFIQIYDSLALNSANPYTVQITDDALSTADADTLRGNLTRNTFQIINATVGISNFNRFNWTVNDTDFLAANSLGGRFVVGNTTDGQFGTPDTTGIYLTYAEYAWRDVNDGYRDGTLSPTGIWTAADDTTANRTQWETDDSPDRAGAAVWFVRDQNAPATITIDGTGAAANRTIGNLTIGSENGSSTTSYTVTGGNIIFDNTLGGVSNTSVITHLATSQVGDIINSNFVINDNNLEIRALSTNALTLNGTMSGTKDLAITGGGNLVLNTNTGTGNHIQVGNITITNTNVELNKNYGGNGISLTKTMEITGGSFVNNLTTGAGIGIRGDANGAIVLTNTKFRNIGTGVGVSTDSSITVANSDLLNDSNIRAAGGIIATGTSYIRGNGHYTGALNTVGSTHLSPGGIYNAATGAIDHSIGTMIFESSQSWDNVTYDWQFVDFSSGGTNDMIFINGSLSLTQNFNLNAIITGSTTINETRAWTLMASSLGINFSTQDLADWNVASLTKLDTIASRLGGGHLELVVNGNALQLQYTVSTLPEFIWLTNTSTGTWATGTNWEGGAAPTRGNHAQFIRDQTDGAVIDVDAGTEVGHITIGSENGGAGSYYTLQGNSITFNTTTGADSMLTHYANAVEGDTIESAIGLDDNNLVIKLFSSNSLTLNGGISQVGGGGASSHNVTIEGMDGTGALVINAPASATGIAANDIIIGNATLVVNSATTSTGLSASRDLTIFNSTFTSNAAGGLNSTGLTASGTLSIIGGNFINRVSNSATGISAQSSSDAQKVVIGTWDFTTEFHNEVGGSGTGTGIFLGSNPGETMLITNTQFTSNVSGGSYGIRNANGPLSILGGNFVNNVTGGTAGIYIATLGTLNIGNATVATEFHNDFTGGTDTAGIYTFNIGALTSNITNASFTNNANGTGNAIQVTLNSRLNITDGSFVNNATGGTGINFAGATAIHTIDNVNFQNIGSTTANAIINAGTINVRNGSSMITTNATIINRGTMTFEDTSMLRLYEKGQYINTGTFTGPGIDFATGGNQLLAGTGTYNTQLFGLKSTTHISPGDYNNQTGLSNFGTLTINTAQDWSTFTYDWQLGIANDEPDLIAIGTSLNLSGTTTGSYTLNLSTLGTLGSSATETAWQIISGTITGFNADYWDLNNQSEFLTALNRSSSNLAIQQFTGADAGLWLVLLGDYVWNENTTGLWSESAKWEAYPTFNAVGKTVYFIRNQTADTGTITVDNATVTIGNLTIGSDIGNHTITGNLINMDTGVGGTGSTLTHLANAQAGDTIASNITFNSDLTINTLSANNHLTLSGELIAQSAYSGNGRNLIKTGTGSLLTTNTINTGTGTYDLQQGHHRIHTGTLTASLLTVRSGASIGGNGTIAANILFEADSIIKNEKRLGARYSDRFNLTGTSTFQGNASFINLANFSAIASTDAVSGSSRVITTEMNYISASVFNLNAAATYTLDLYNEGTYDITDWTKVQDTYGIYYALVLTGSLDNINGFDGTTWNINLMDASGNAWTGDGNWEIYKGTQGGLHGIWLHYTNPTRIPEPSTYAMIVAAIALIGTFITKRRKRKYTPSVHV